MKEIKEKCPLCPPVEHITEWKYEDHICYICKCANKNCGLWMIVLKHHGEPTEGELQYLQRVSKRFFPDKKWRGIRRQILGHWHEHFCP